MNTGQVILLIVYGLGYLITFLYQRKEINSLKTQVNSQSEILSNAERFMKIFDVDKYEKHVTFLEKSFHREFEQKLKEKGKEQEEKLTKTIKEASEKDFNIAINAVRELLSLIHQLSILFVNNPIFEKAINGMKEGFVKKQAQGILKETSDNYRNHMLFALLSMKDWPSSNKSDKNPFK